MLIKSKIIKNIAILCLLGVGAITLISCGEAKQADAGSAEATGVVHIGTIQNPNDETIAIKKEYFQEEIGKNVEVSVFDSGADVNVALASGSIDFAYLGSSPATIALSQGNTEAEVIWIHRIIGSVESLTTRKSANINSIKDLKGKTVAAPFSTTTHYSLLRILEKEGVDPKTVNILDMSGPEMLAAWENGQIDAAYIWDPFLGQFSDSKILVTSTDVAKAGFPTSDVELVNKKFAEKNPEVVVSYIKAVNKAVKLHETSPEEAGKALADVFQIPQEEADKQMLGFTWIDTKDQLLPENMGTSESKGKLVDSLYDTAKFLYEQKNLSKMPEKDVFEKSINPSYIEKALEE